jgi:cardiolipin synthase A/B
MEFDGWVAATLTVLAVAVDVVIRVVSVIVVPIDRRPQTAAAWLLAIFFIPYVGFLLFLLFGSRRLPKSRRERQATISTYVLETTAGTDRVKARPDAPAWLPRVVELNRRLGAMPLMGGNTAVLMPDYDESIRTMTEAVDSAQRYVHVEFYILHLDSSTRPFFEALAAARRRGVVVRVLLDHVASRGYPAYRRTRKFLDDADLQWRLMLPVKPLQGKWQRPDLRNHRKLLVVDGDLAFTGSQNMIDKSYGRRAYQRKQIAFRDLNVRFEGPIAAGINALFATDWYSETDELLLRDTEPATVSRTPDTIDCQVVPSGPAFDGENNLRLFNTLLYSAQQRIRITSPYFVPDESMLYAITTAAQRGVEVSLFVGELGDHFFTYHAQRSYYESLLRAGVRIHLYPAPSVLHSKCFTIDGDVGVIGSSNMDMRSFSLNLEISVMVTGGTFVDDLDAVMDRYQAKSRELTLDEWLRRPRVKQVLDNVARLTASVQ